MGSGLQTLAVSYKYVSCRKIHFSIYHNHAGYDFTRYPKPQLYLQNAQREDCYPYQSLKNTFQYTYHHPKSLILSLLILITKKPKFITHLKESEFFTSLRKDLLRLVKLLDFFHSIYLHKSAQNSYPFFRLLKYGRLSFSFQEQ